MVGHTTATPCTQKSFNGHPFCWIKKKNACGLGKIANVLNTADSIQYHNNCTEELSDYRTANAWSDCAGYLYCHVHQCYLRPRKSEIKCMWENCLIYLITWSWDLISHRFLGYSLSSGCKSSSGYGLLWWPVILPYVIVPRARQRRILRYSLRRCCYCQKISSPSNTHKTI